MIIMLVDDLQLLIEDIFNIDVAGDPMMERLGFLGNIELSEYAINHKITRLGGMFEDFKFLIENKSDENNLGLRYVTLKELKNIIVDTADDSG